MSIVCTKCRTSQTRDAMGKSASGKDGLHSWCRQRLRGRARDKRKKPTPETQACRNLWSRYRLTTASHDATFEKQGGVCAICRGAMTRVCVDHDHLIGHVRGLLCHSCNVKLHALGAWPHRDAAIAYLQADPT